MTSTRTGNDFVAGYESPVPAGHWRVDPARSSAAFAARIAGRPVGGRFPLSGEAHVAVPVEDSTAHLVAAAHALQTDHAMLDRVLLGSGFLDVAAFPKISFRAEQLVRVPTGWRALGQLRIKASEHTVVCEVDADVHEDHAGGAVVMLNSRWVIDATWITRQRVPGLSRRISMSCAVALEPAG